MRQTLSIAWPLLLNGVLHQSMVVVDTLLVSPLGSVSVAALGIASTFMFFCLGVQFAFASGTQLILARCLGEADDLRVTENYHAGRAINVLVTLLFALLFFMMPKAFLLWILESADVVPLVQSYLRIGAVTMIFASLSQIEIVRFNSARLTKIPLIGLGLEIPVNLIVSYSLVHGISPLFDGLGLAGAAWGSLVAMLLRLGYLRWRAQRAFPANDSVPTRRLESITIWRHGAEATPIALNYLTLTTGMMLYQLLFARLPVEQYAAIVLLLPWIRMGGQVGTAWGQASSIQVSRMLGAGQQTGLSDYLRKSIGLSVIFSLLVSFFFVVVLLSLTMVFPELDQGTMTAVWAVAPWFIALPLTRIVNTVQGQSLRALKQSRFVLAVHVSTQWCFALPLCALFIATELSVFWVFSVLFFEEALKTYPFYHRLRTFPFSAV